MLIDFKPITLIEEQTGAVTDVAFIPIQQRFLDVSIVATGLAGAEAVPLLFSVDNGETFQAIQQGGSPLELTETNNVIRIPYPIFLGVTKPATAGAAGVFVFANEKAGQQ